MTKLMTAARARPCSLASRCWPAPAARRPSRPRRQPLRAICRRSTFEKYTLPNGLEVILSEDHRLPLVAVNLWYHVGPANEDPGRTGFAHLFEHMMFQGSKHVPGDTHFQLARRAPARSDVNGTTDFDRTNYFETMPANQLELALWLESDRMGYLLDQVDQANLSNQQDVVRNERRQSVENQPYGIVEEALFHQLFPKEHPYYASVIGSHADIQAAKLDDVKNFFKLYYAPNNASLAIVGDIDKAATKALVEKYFGTLKQGQPVPKPSVQTPPITAERRAVVQDRVELPRVYMAWLTPPIFKPGDADADIAATALGGGQSSRLYKKLVYEKQIAQDVSAAQYSLMLGSVFQITATARPGHTAEELEKAIDEELATFRQNGPDQTRSRSRPQRHRDAHRPGARDARRLRRRRRSPEHVQPLPRRSRLSAEGHQAVSRRDAGVGEDVRRPAARRRTRASSCTACPARPISARRCRRRRSRRPHPGTGAESVNPDEPWRKDTPKAGRGACAAAARRRRRSSCRTA